MRLTCMVGDVSLHAMNVQASRIKNIGIRVQPELHEKFREAADANHRTIQGELQALMEKRVREYAAEREVTA